MLIYIALERWIDGVKRLSVVRFRTESFVFEDYKNE